MKHIIPAKNWHMEIAKAIDNALPGDVIVVRDEAQAELAKNAKQRMCPDKQISFVVEQEEW